MLPPKMHQAIFKETVKSLQMIYLMNARTDIRKRAFVYSAPLAWNMLQKHWKLNKMIPLNAFRSKVNVNVLFTW